MNEPLLQIDSNVEDLKKLLDLASTQAAQLQTTVQKINQFQLTAIVSKA